MFFGIDPGSRLTGWGAVKVEGNRYSLGDCGVISVSEKKPLSERLQQIFEQLNELLEQHNPQMVFLESIFHHKYARSALVLGHARGVALLAAQLRNCPIGEISPTEVKKAVTGRGRADKEQVQHMVRMLLGMPEIAQVDASDALAVAFAGATRAQFAQRFAHQKTPNWLHRSSRTGGK